MVRLDKVGGKRKDEEQDNSEELRRREKAAQAISPSFGRFMIALRNLQAEGK